MSDRRAFQPLAYDDLASASEMSADCRAAVAALRLPRRPTPAERAARAAVRPAPSILFEDYPQEIKKTDIAVTEAAARLASAMHLHLD
jgi:hypothetical protein